MPTINARLDRLELLALQRFSSAPNCTSADQLLARLRRKAIVAHQSGPDGSEAGRVAMIMFNARGESTAESLQAGLAAIHEYLERQAL